MAAACYMSVYVDGVRIWAAGSRDPPDFDQLRNNQYEGVEIYRGPAELPTQYAGTGAACGAILLWSRISP
jgi:outer membrane receptor for monomeric catechols